MADNPIIDWFKRSFGDEQTGPQYGAIGGVAVGGILGYLVGGGTGPLIGAAGSVILAASINVLFHRIPGVINQPSGPPVTRIVASPILDNLAVPEDGDVPGGLAARNRVREMIVNGGSSREAFEAAVREARSKESRVENFFTAMREYQERQQAYAAGEYQQLVTSVSAY